MFTILDQENPTVDELADGYLRIEQAKQRFEKEHESLNSNFVRLQQLAMSGQDVHDDVRAAKEKLWENDSKLVACQNGMDSLLLKMPIAMQDDIRKQISDIQKAISGLEKELDLGMAEVVELYARAFCRDCEVRGAHLPERPGFEINESTIGKYWAEYKESVRRISDERGGLSPKKSINHRIWNLESQIHGIKNNIAASAASDADEVQGLLKKRRAVMAGNAVSEEPVKDRNTKPSPSSFRPLFMAQEDESGD